MLKSEVNDLKNTFYEEIGKIKKKQNKNLSNHLSSNSKFKFARSSSQGNIITKTSESTSQ
jgi:hypothetical protein